MLSAKKNTQGPLHYFERFTLLSVPSLEHFFEWPTHLSPLLSKATHLSPFLSKPTRLSTFLSTQKSRFALESTFLSVFALLSTFLSAQKNAQGPAQPTSIPYILSIIATKVKFAGISGGR